MMLTYHLKFNKTSRYKLWLLWCCN